MNLDDLRDGAGFATTESGEDLSPETVRRMACDSEVIPVVLGSSSEVLDVGRHMRLASVAIWRALVVRDRHCRFPGCTRPPIMCHAHHLIHWLHGGETSLENLLLLCGHHHRLIQSGPWIITRAEPGHFQFDPTRRVRRARGPRLDCTAQRHQPTEAGPFETGTSSFLRDPERGRRHDGDAAILRRPTRRLGVAEDPVHAAHSLCRSVKR